MDSRNAPDAPGDEDLHPTVSMTAVTPPPRPADPPTIEHEPLHPAAESLPVHPAPPGSGTYVPLGPTVPMPGPTIVVPPVRTRVFGNPFSYVFGRFLALLLDVALPTVAIAAVLYGTISVNPLTGLPTNSQGAFDFTVAAAAGVTLLYLVLAQAIFGTTLGKLLLGLHVYPMRGRFVGFGRALVRTILLPLDLIGIGFVLGLLPGHRRLGDLLGGTVVAKSPLRAFAPLLGAIGILLLAGLPFVIGGGVEKVFSTLAAFVEFGPPLIARGVGAAFGLFGAVAGSAGATH